MEFQSASRLLDRLDRARSFALAALVAGVALAVVVPITMGVLRAPPADIGDGWCGTWTFRMEHADCPTCCEQFGAYRLRGQIILSFVVFGVGTLVAAFVTRWWLDRWHASEVAEARCASAERAVDQLTTEHSALTAQIEAFDQATTDRTESDGSMTDVDRRSGAASERQRSRVERRLRDASTKRDELVASRSDT